VDWKPYSSPGDWVTISFSFLSIRCRETVEIKQLKIINNAIVNASVISLLLSGCPVAGESIKNSQFDHNLDLICPIGQFRQIKYKYEANF
jgi:hypothetical protein